MKKAPESIYVYVDEANVGRSMEHIIDFDYVKLLRYIRRLLGSAKIKYYTAKPKRENLFHLKLIRELEKSGVTVIEKDIKLIRQGKGGTKAKCDVDPEIITDMLLDRRYYDTVVLISGDSDFTYPLQRLKRMGRKIVICSTPDAISRELEALADMYINMNEILSRMTK